MEHKASVEAKILAAKLAIQEMLRSWHHWKIATEEEARLSYIADYSAAFLSCKTYLESYLQSLYPNEKKVPMKISQDIQNIISHMEAIEKTNEKELKKAIEGIEQLSQDVA